MQDSRVEQLSGRLDAAQRQLTAVESRLAVQPAQAPAVAATDPGAAEQVRDIDRERAEEAERHRDFMLTVQQRFAAERVDINWANRASDRVGSAFSGDDTLRNLSRKVECREQMCRVEIEDDGTGQLSTRMPVIAMGVADVLPNISAEHVDRGDGRGALVLYMSSQPFVQVAAQGK
jgi:hypothetical protein